MKISLDWLKDFVDIEVSVDELSAKLVSAGFEVEEIIKQSDGMKNVVLGRIESLSKHPDADKLQICQLNVGKSELVQIVTGAQNVAVGDLVPVALDNSSLPNGAQIKNGKLRGVISNGMLCSGEELKLTDAEYKGASVYGILIMNDEKYPLGTDMNVVLDKDDTILDIGVTANRGDCNCVLGIAREVATVLKKPLKMPNLSYKTTKNAVSDIIKVSVQNAELCPRYIAGGVQNVKIMPSAKKIQKRLKAVGLRPVNNIVDITNYVLMEIGQPMHAFDKNELCGNEIIARNAENGEKIKALDGNIYELNSSMLVIADKEKACAIAGVMGGEASAIKENTTTIIFECAKFLRDNIRRTARTLNLHSDSSFRFERGIDFDSQRIGMARALALVSEYGYGDVMSGEIDKLNADLSPRIIQVSVSKINSILGIEVPANVMVDILNSLQIQTVLKDNTLVCQQPIFRDDIENANDLAEEIIRLYGYDHINCTLMDKGKQTVGGKTQAQKNVDILKNIAVNNGMSEILTYSFTTPKCFDILHLDENDSLRNAIKLLNPLGEDLSVMRTTLAYSMINALAKNYLKNLHSAKLFEVANVYLPKQFPVTEQPNEVKKIVFGAYGDGFDYYTLKGIIEKIMHKFGIKESYNKASINYMHHGRSAQIVAGQAVLGYIGEVNPSVAESFDVKDRMYIGELDIDLMNKIADESYKFVEIAKYPPMERDLAVIVNEDVTAADILACVNKGGGNMLKESKIFDIYRNDALGQNKKSVAISMTFRLPDRTLTDEEVVTKMNRILNKLIQEFDATLRQA